MANILSPRRLYLNEDRTKVVEEGPQAHYLFRAQGLPITEEEIKQYHLEEILGRKPEDKSVKLPQETPTQHAASIQEERPAENKGGEDS